MQQHTYTAFVATHRIAAGPIEEVALAAHQWQRLHDHALVQVFEDDTGQPIDLDLRGEPDDVIAALDRHPLLERGVPAKSAGPGRPRLGVVSREVSLLPRHWRWLRLQPKSASATMRMLIEAHMKRTSDKDRVRKAVNAAYAIMSALAGDLPGFEEASRKLFAHDFDGVDAQIAAWPEDVRAYVRRQCDARTASSAS